MARAMAGERDEQQPRQEGAQCNKKQPGQEGDAQKAAREEPWGAAGLEKECWEGKERRTRSPNIQAGPAAQ